MDLSKHGARWGHGVIGVFFAILTAPAIAGAALSCEEPTKDLGYRLVGRSISHTFSLRNEGTTDLTLAVGATSCGCIVTDPPSEPIAPGTSGEITIGYNPKPTSPKHGQNSFSLTLNTNDPSQKAIVLALKAHLVEPVHCATPELNFDAEESVVLEIVCLEDGVLPKILSVTSGSSLVSIQELEGVASVGERRYRYEVRLPDVGARGDFSSSIAVETDSPRVPRLEVGVRRTGEQLFQAEPPRGHFGRVSSGETVVRKIALTWEEKYKPVRTEVEIPELVATIQETLPGHGIVTLELTGRAKEGGGTKAVNEQVSLFASDGKKLGEIPILAIIVP